MNKMILIGYDKSFSFFFLQNFWMILPLIKKKTCEILHFKIWTTKLISVTISFWGYDESFQIIENLYFQNYTTRLFNDCSAVISLSIM